MFTAGDGGILHVGAWAVPVILVCASPALGCAACDIVAPRDSVMKSRQRMLELTIRSVASCLVCSCRNFQCALKCASTMSDLVG